MPQSLARVVVHIVFSTKNREPWLDDELRPRVFAYLAEVGRDHECEVYRVGGMPDHVHLAVQLGRTISVANLVKVVKQTSSVWIKREGRNHGGFAWQAGYGAFSVGVSQLPALVEYIDKQEEHHRAKGFQEEYRGFLKRYGLDYDERYVWD